LLDYLRYQRDHQPPPMPQPSHHRLSVLRCLYRFHYGREIPRRDGLGPTRSPRSPFGYGGPRRTVSGLGPKRPRRLVVPLSADEVARFWRSFRTFRDLSLVALMLYDGLRSQETLALQLGRSSSGGSPASGPRQRQQAKNSGNSSDGGGTYRDRSDAICRRLRWQVIAAER
jgi:hypothetical protein